jgi:hypothetical protein
MACFAVRNPRRPTQSKWKFSVASSLFQHLLVASKWEVKENPKRKLNTRKMQGGDSMTVRSTQHHRMYM